MDDGPALELAEGPVVGDQNRAICIAQIFAQVRIAHDHPVEVPFVDHETEHIQTVLVGDRGFGALVTQEILPPVKVRPVQCAGLILERVGDIGIARAVLKFGIVREAHRGPCRVIHTAIGEDESVSSVNRLLDILLAIPVLPHRLRDEGQLAGDHLALESGFCNEPDVVDTNRIGLPRAPLTAVRDRLDRV